MYGDYDNQGNLGYETRYAGSSSMFVTEKIHEYDALDRLTPIIYGPSAAAHQHPNPIISLLNDAMHRLRGSISGFER